MSKSHIFIFAALGIFSGIGVGLGSNAISNSNFETRVFAEIPRSLTPTPSVIVPEPVETETMDSPDGEMKLTLEKQKTGSNIKQVFFTSSKSENTKKEIFKKETIIPTEINIPYNSWSPDNKFLFLEEKNPIKNNYFVFYANGQDFKTGSSYIDVQSLFQEKVKGFVIVDVTGWASPTLLLINTRSEAGGGGKASFWLDVNSQSFIRLSTYFR